MSSYARASSPVGIAATIDGWPNNSPSPRRSTTRPVVDELDRAIADHAQRARRFRALLEDRRPGRKAFLPGSLREERDGRGVQLVERRMP